MLFCSYEFALLFIITYVLYITCSAHVGWRAAKNVLLAASVFSYSYWYYPHALVLGASIAVTYVCGLRIHAAPDRAAKRAWLAAGIGLSLALLIVFKYAAFGAKAGNALLKSLGSTASLPLPEILLPIGISFFTFHGISYIVDIYRGLCPPVSRFLDYAFFMSSFIQLMAGPIIRAAEFLPQLVKAKRFNRTFLEWGGFLIILGAFKKLVIADNISLPVDFFYELPSYDQVPASFCLFYSLAYSVQIYADFSGYTDMARGMGYLLGFRLPFNFHYPYVALGFRDFWRRWHISLSRWFRDYFFIPIGGSRGTRLGLARNLLLTMLLVGIWHGAHYIFVIWGLMHGALLLFDHLVLTPYVISRVKDKNGPAPALIRGAVRLFTFLGVNLAWVFFRSVTLDQAFAICRRLAAICIEPFILPPGLEFILPPLIIIAAMHLASLLRHGDRLHRRFPWPVNLTAAAVMLVMIAFNRPGADNAFIYFQF